MSEWASPAIDGHDMSVALEEGRLARTRGRPATDNPYSEYERGCAWCLGWHAAQFHILPLAAVRQAISAGVPGARYMKAERW